MTLWAGRVEVRLAPEVWAFLRAHDAELLPYDCEGTRLHAARLHVSGLLTDQEHAEVVTALTAIAQGGHADLSDSEDVHSAIERSLGEVGRKIHAGRSRNDQVVAAMRLYVEDACAEALEAIGAFALGLLDVAEAEAETVMPGYTHLQRAQPVTLGHHLLAWVEMLDRDRARFRFAATQAAESPLGAGALAGSTLPVPSPPGAMRNSLDAVADRDFALDYLYAGDGAVRPPVADRRGDCPLVVVRIRFRSAAGVGGDGLVDDAAEAEPRRRGAVARQGGHGNRPADRPARDGQGPAARVQPRPPGGQAPGLRRTPRRAGGARLRWRRSSAGSTSTGTASPPPRPIHCSSRPTPRKRSSPRVFRSATPTSEWRGRCGKGTFDPDTTAAESVAVRLGDVRAAIAEARSRFVPTL